MIGDAALAGEANSPTKERQVMSMTIVRHRVLFSPVFAAITSPCSIALKYTQANFFYYMYLTAVSLYIMRPIYSLPKRNYVRLTNNAKSSLSIDPDKVEYGIHKPKYRDV